MSQPEIMNFGAFRQRYLDPLGAGDEALHGQLFPAVYPPDHTIHNYLKRDMRLPNDIVHEFGQFQQFVGSLHERRVTLLRLRTLPATLNEDVPAMVKACEMTQNAGEQVRVTLFEQQLARLALTTTPAHFTEALQAPVPRAGIWSIRQQGQHGFDSPRPVGTMDYGDDGILPGLVVYEDVPSDLEAYATFWHDVYHSDQSVPLDNWRQLY